MKTGLTGYGSYVPRLRLSRKAAAEANDWFAPQMVAGARGTRAFANWDEDTITMAVAAARDCLPEHAARSRVRSLLLASSTLPFADRLNAGIARAALRLEENITAADLAGSQTAALTGLAQALTQVRAGVGDVLLLAADVRKTRAGSSQELDYGDAAAALSLGSENLIAECLGHASLTVDFVDRFRLAGQEIDYHWEERWVRDEGVLKLVPQVIQAALTQSATAAEAVDRFVFPSSLPKIQAQVAARCSVPAEAVVDPMEDSVGNSGVAHGLLMLASTLETARPGQIILLAQFGGGAQAFVFRVTEAITAFKPKRLPSEAVRSGVVETRYTRFLAYKGQLPVERGMRGEQDLKTALTTAHRHRDALTGLVAGRCRVTGEVHFPPSRISYTPGSPALDTQGPHPLAERQGTVLSWSAEYLSFHLAPPHQYGQVDFDGGGRILMDFTDVSLGDIAAGTRVEMAFRVKDIDERRGFKRYFWKAIPVRAVAATEKC
jgi:3-hydroxy-3-methylglutaryl CoA synthase